MALGAGPRRPIRKLYSWRERKTNLGRSAYADGGLAQKEAPMGTADEYRRTAWDCLSLAEATSNPETRASMLDLAQVWMGLAEKVERVDHYRVVRYRAKAYECQSRAQRAEDPQCRADLETFAQLWMSLTESGPDLRGAYEMSSSRHH
jgi:hypothetical protein